MPAGPKPFERELLASMRTHGVEREDTVLAAVSGGADSVAMLVALATLSRAEGPRVVCAHMNHLLREPHSSGDASFVEANCRRMEVPFFLRETDVLAVAEKRRENLEAVARSLRYEFLIEQARELGIRIVLTAHTADDQAETVVMRLARGAGIDGLSGIASERQLADDVRVVRPLLRSTRVDVLQYCREKDVEFRTDATNFDTNQTRSLVRHELLPLLERVSPGAARNIARLADIASREAAYANDLARNAIDDLGLTIANDSIVLRVDRFLSLPTPMRRRIIREMLRLAKGDLKRIEASHIEIVDDLAAHVGASADLPGGIRVEKTGSSLRFITVNSR